MAILTHVSDAELAAFVDAYSLGGPLTKARGVEAGTVNTSFLLEVTSPASLPGLTAARYFLRIYEEQDATGAARESRVLGHLASKGVPTPAPIVAKDGAAMRMVAGKPAALFPWIDGDIVCQSRVSVEHAHAIGAALARIHAAGHAPDAVLDEGRFAPRELVTRCDRVRSSKDPEGAALADSLRDAVLRFAERRDERHARTPTGLIHGDLFRDNVLWSADSGDTYRIAALLDFESAHDGPFAYDVAVTILSWSFGSEFDMRIANAIVRGYESVRPLEEGDRNALYDETIFAALRFTITRITDDAIRVGKKWRRFVARREALEAMGSQGFLGALGL